MKERVNRQGDENLYQPKIHSQRIKDLYLIRSETGIPMTVLVDLAIVNFIGIYYSEHPHYEFRSVRDIEKGL